MAEEQESNQGVESTVVSSEPVEAVPAGLNGQGTVTPDLEVGQFTQNYIEAYHATSEWIRFADAKAAVILTVGGAVAGLLVPTIHSAISGDKAQAEHLIPAWQPTVLILFTLFIIFLLLSGVFAFLCINPLRKKGRHPSIEHCSHFHPAAISARYEMQEVQRFIADCDATGEVGLLREVQAGLLLDAHISTQKYNKVKYSLRLFSTSMVFGFLYFLFLQF